MDKTNIRKANFSDLEAIRNLVVELAIYEKEPDAVTATLEDYQNNFKNNWFECHVAEKEGKVIGMILYYNTYSTWKGRMLYLEDFVVAEAYRRQGVGELLFEKLFEIAKEKEAKLIKWQVLDWNEPAIQFYKKYEGMIMEDNWNNCKIFM
jgi:ribosomal protein S18 acetylase RimI-like enzyme